MKQLLLVDDDHELCSLLSAYLRAEGFTTTVTHDGDNGVEAAISGQHDGVILDIMMPSPNGIDALREIRRHSDVPIIMLTARGDTLDRVVALEMGADDYVAKPYDPRELIARLRAVMRRRGQGRDGQAGEALQCAGMQLSSSARTVAWHGTAIELTASEFNVLEALMRARGAVRSKDALTSEALGRRREGYDRSLDVHISNIRHKLIASQANDVEIETVRGVGYRMKALT